MAESILKSFPSLPEAQHALHFLADAGFCRNSLWIESRLDEAGGTAGNFTVGNTSAAHAPHPPQAAPAGNTDDTAYRTDFTPVAWNGVILLMADLDSVEQERASALLQGLGSDPQRAGH
jgi:hypothetical protein